MNVKNIDIKLITPYVNNPRKNDSAISYVAASIKEFGWKQPIVVDKNMTIVVGHTRYEAALLLGLKEVPVLIANDLTSSQIKAYRIADNKTAEFAEWDLDLLKIELEALLEDNYDIDVLGLSEQELNELTDISGISDINEIGDEDEIKVEPEDTVVFGQIWKLGIHQLICGDSLIKKTVEKEILKNENETRY